MSYVVLGLFAEGSTDRRTLPSFIRREAINLIGQRGRRPVEVQERVLVFSERTNQDRATAMCNRTSEVHVFALHGDARLNRRDEVLANLHDQVRQLAQALCDFDGRRVVNLIPSAELESWLLVDPDAVARACGYRQWPDQMPFVCRPDAVENLSDAKQSLEQAIDSLSPSGRVRRRLRAAAIIEQLADEIPLSLLQRLRSYREFAESLSEALDAAGAFR